MKNKLIILFILTLILITIALTKLIFKEIPSPGKPRITPVEKVVRCTADVIQCPDGSYVGRIPPSCDFAPCPK